MIATARKARGESNQPQQIQDRRHVVACGTRNDLTDEPKVVGLRGFRLINQLARHLRRLLNAPKTAPAVTALPAYHGRRWRVRGRLSKQDILDLVTAFKAGTAKHILAKRYAINLRSLKKLLRDEGVKRKSWNDVQA